MAVRVNVRSGGAEVEGVLEGETVVIAAHALEELTGWHLEPSGLCRGDRCVPAQHLRIEPIQGQVDLSIVARLLDRHLALEPSAGVAELGAEAPPPPTAGPAPGLSLPDLDGRDAELFDGTDRKRLLLAFASW